MQADYVRGFTEKCAELGVDPEVLVKLSQIGNGSPMQNPVTRRTASGGSVTMPQTSVNKMNANRTAATTRNVNVNRNRLNMQRSNAGAAQEKSRFVSPAGMEMKRKAVAGMGHLTNLNGLK